jgi:TPR repeat protein
MRIPKPIQVTLLAVVVVLGACSTTNKSETKSELRQRAQSGDIDARYQLGERYADATFANKPEAIYWLCLAAREGHVPAQMRLAKLFEAEAASGSNDAGKSRLSNKGSAYFWYTAAASQGDDQAFSSREALAGGMDAAEIENVKRKATRWQQAGCVEPS